MTKSVPYASKARDEITNVLRRFGWESVGTICSTPKFSTTTSTPNL
jgi:hypothetical protein